MESDSEDRKSRHKSVKSKKEPKDLNLSHEDLSDVSDLDSVGPEDNDKERRVIMLCFSNISNPYLCIKSFMFLLKFSIILLLDGQYLTVQLLSILHYKCLFSNIYSVIRNILVPQECSLKTEHFMWVKGIYSYLSSFDLYN